MFAECEDDDTRWVINNALGFWTACPTRRCRRERSCSGDSRRCHAIFWPVVPEEMKVRWRAVLDAKRDGRTARQAGRLAEKAGAEWRKRAELMQKLRAK
jgi:nitrous oxide reductase